MAIYVLAVAEFCAVTMVPLACVRARSTAPRHDAAADGGVLTVSVEPVYPRHARWNDYVRNHNGGSDRFDQADEACRTDEPGKYDRCLHGGELRKVVLADHTSCAGLTIRDGLDAFGWVCRETVAGVIWHTTGLKTESTLAMLLSAEGFRPNWVEVLSEEQLVARSEEQVWWSNPVVPLPDNSASSAKVVALEKAGAVYVLATSRETNGYNLNADRISVATLPGAVLSLRPAAPANCNAYTGESSPPATPDDEDLRYWRPAILCGGNQRFLWLEGEYHNPLSEPPANDFNSGVVLLGSDRTVLRHVSVQGGGYGVVFYGSAASLLYDIRAMRSGKYGLIVGGGWELGQGRDNIVSRIFITNASGNVGQAAVLIGRRAPDNIVTQVLSASSGPYGVLQYQTGNDNNIYSHITSASCTFGIALEGSDNAVVVQAVSVNSTSHGVRLQNMTNTRSAQLVAAHNHRRGIALEGDTTGSTFGGTLLVGNNREGDCPGCALEDAHVVTDVDLAATFIGQVSSDSVNGESSGLVEWENLGDWLHFENDFRGWGKESSGFPNHLDGGRCIEEPCQLWDWRLSATDTQLANRSGGGTEPNAPFVEGKPCPAAVHGDQSISDAADTTTFLINALEIFFDAVGDDDGLCESNEACVYSPHFGAYQGEGAIGPGTCGFVDGAVKGVMLYQRETLTPQ